MIHKKHVNRYAEIQDEDFDSVSKHFEQITHSSMNEMNNFLIWSSINQTFNFTISIRIAFKGWYNFPD